MIRSHPIVLTTATPGVHWVVENAKSDLCSSAAKLESNGGDICILTVNHRVSNLVFLCYQWVESRCRDDLCQSFQVFGVSVSRTIRLLEKE